jgi:D-apionolactonase
LPSVFASVRELAPDRPYRLGPATIGMRENPYAAAVTANPQRLRLTCARLDPRHHARFGAVFALGIVAAAASAKVAVVTLADLVGDFGLLDARQAPTPLAHLLTALAPYAGRPSRAVVVPAGVAALATEAAEGPVVFIGSLQSAATRLLLPPGRWASRTIFGTRGAVSPQVVDGSVELPPFAALELRAR